jgi:hypothetical protein
MRAVATDRIIEYTAGAMLWRAAFLAIALYVTCDALFPMMPGAFVFDAAESVESVQHVRPGAVWPDVAPTPLRVVQPGPSVASPRPAQVRAASLDVLPRVSVLLRGALESPAASEDPH